MTTQVIKERPILFSGEMVRAILAGTKTQTRRVVKPQPPFGCIYEINGAYSHALCSGVVDGVKVWVPPTGRSIDHRLPCPFGAPGERLWVRETFAADVWNPEDIDFHYRATYEGPERRWEPSIHMPRYASRITLEVTGVRVERLRDISEEDARAEGVGEPHYPSTVTRPYSTLFHVVWERINGPVLGNPWVWVVEFRRLP